MSVNQASHQALLDTLINALLRDEDWRGLVEGPLDPEVERLMAVAEQIHRAAGDFPEAGPRQRLRVWDRVFHRGQGATPSPRLLSMRGFTGVGQLWLARRRLGAPGRAPGHSLLQECGWP